MRWINCRGAVVLLASCGGVHSGYPDAAGASCEPHGSGTISGTAKGQAIGPVASAFILAAGGMSVLVLDDANGVCAQPAATGYHVNVQFCAPPAVASYPGTQQGSFHCPDSTTHVYANIKNDVNGLDYEDGFGGTLTIEAVTPACVRGSYALNFDQGNLVIDTLMGEFDAVVCP